MDAFGQLGFDPGSGCGSGTTTTVNATLRRLCSVTTGDQVATDAFDPAAESAGLAVDSFSGLGSPDCAP